MLIKILTGQRRIGKSYILRQLMGIIQEQDANAQLVYISKELKVYENIKTEDDLYNHIDKQLEMGKNNYVFIDEIQ